MGPFPSPYGHDFPRLVDKLVPGFAGEIDDIVVGQKTLLDSQLSRMNCQVFSAGFNSGDLGGRGRSVKLAGIFSLSVVCQPA